MSSSVFYYTSNICLKDLERIITDIEVAGPWPEFEYDVFRMGFEHFTILAIYHAASFSSCKIKGNKIIQFLKIRMIVWEELRN
jgi:hypothetical protein